MKGGKIMHIFPAIENNADEFSSLAFNLFKQQPPLPSTITPGFPERSSGNSRLFGHGP